MPERSSGTASGAIQILVATAIGGGAGYVLTVFAGARLGAAGYVPFAVFWSALYLLISAASGVQQEVTRATSVTHASPTSPIARNFALGAAAVVFTALALSAILWAPLVFGTSAWSLVWPLAVGISAYVVLAVFAGTLYGLRLWRPISILIVLDGLLRLVLVFAALLVTSDMAVIAWAIAAPFFLAPAIVWPLVRRQVVGRFQLDVGYTGLVRNVGHTVVGAAATGVLISGFPLLLDATSGSASSQTVGAIVFASNLTRAPIVIVVVALQSYLIVRFRANRESAGRQLAAIIAVIAVAAGVLALLAWLFGEWVFTTFFDAGFVLPPAVLASLVASAAAVASLCATGPFVLAAGRHFLFTAGWVTAALVTVGLLLAPLDVTERSLLALWIGPLSGLAVHLSGYLLDRLRPAGS